MALWDHDDLDSAREEFFAPIIRLRESRAGRWYVLFFLVALTGDVIRTIVT